MSSASNKSSLGGEPHPFEAATAYVPRVLLEAIAVDPHRASPWHESVDGTLVMADVSGFTAMSERLAAAGREGAECVAACADRVVAAVGGRRRPVG